MAERRTAGTEQRHFVAIQVLRGVAALLVVVCHLHLALPDDAGGRAVAAWLAPATAPLAIGVDIFFVISGFVVATTIDGDRPPDWRRFLLRRALRIYPLYWLATLTFLPSVASGVGLGARPIGAGDVLLSLTLLPQTGLIVEQGWTLTHELLFYGVAATALAAGRGHRLPAILAGLGAVALVQAAAGGPLAHGYVVSCHVLEFLIGVAIHRFREPLALRLAGRNGGLACGMAAAVVAGVTLGIGGEPTAWPEVVRVGLYGVPAGLLVASLVGVELNGGIAADGALVRAGRLLGDTSYSLYLFHPALLGGCGRLAQALPGLSAPAALALAAAGLVVAVGYGVAIGRLVELPLQAWFNARLGRGGGVAPPAVSAAAE